MPVAHEGNPQASEEEVQSIVDLTHDLLGRIFTYKEGSERPIDWHDILYVAPYNHQVNKLLEALGDKAKVGSVDRVQGQQSPIVFLSMCASDANESPRGIGFLFDKHRINVVISRAQSMVIIVVNPRLVNTTAANVIQQNQINLICQLQHRF